MDGIQDIVESIVAEFGSLIAVDERHDQEIAVLKSEVQSLKQKLDAAELDTATLKVEAQRLQEAIAAFRATAQAQANLAQDWANDVQRRADTLQDEASSARLTQSDHYTDLQTIADQAQQRANQAQGRANAAQNRVDARTSDPERQPED